MKTAQVENPPGTRTIAGRVASDGATTFGTGFTSQRTSTGGYSIRFVPGVKVLLAVHVAAISSAYFVSMVSGLFDAGREGFTVVIYNASQGGSDQAFYFTATVVSR